MRLLSTVLFCLAGCALGFSGSVRIPAGTPMPEIQMLQTWDCVVRVLRWKDGQWHTSYAYQRVGDTITVARPSGEETVIEWACMR